MNSCIDRAGFVICICGGFVHQNCFLFTLSYKLGRPHDTYLPYLDRRYPSERRPGQGRHLFIIVLFIILEFGSGNRPFSILPSLCCLYALKSLCTPCLLLGAWPPVLLIGAWVAGWDGEGGGTCLSLYNGFMRYGIRVTPSHFELF
jgi:hypothetical protein